MFSSSHPLDQILHCPSGPFMMMDKRSWTKPHIEIAPNCPRCASSKTKFCYYNNYSLSQPRYFCKGCRRYWTKGGSLRNVPVGGSCRKNRRGKAGRLSQPDRTSLSYFHHHNSSNSTDDDQLGQQSDITNSQPGGSDINLAVVFAKFLNNSSSASSDDHDLNLVVSTSALDDHDHVEAADHLLEGLAVAPDYQHKKLQEENVQSYMGMDHDPDDMMNNHEFGLQGLVGDDDDQVVQDVFWCDDAATTSSYASSTASFTWQPMVHLEQLDHILPSDDDQMKLISTNNLCNDNWSSFDFSGFEVFSRSY